MRLKINGKPIPLGIPGIGIPKGGEDGWILAKGNNEDYNTKWIIPPSNPNLLDNWYFVGGGSQQGGSQFPINQRGETEYTGKNIYTIDRWKTEGTVKIENENIKLSNGGIARQYIENPNLYRGKKITLSAKIKNASSYVSLFMRYNNYETAFSKAFGPVLDGDVLSITGTIPDVELNALFVQISNGNADAEFSIVAAKLELGDHQTLAHKEGDEWVLNDAPPNYVLELLKCQNRMTILSTNSGGYGSFGMGHAWNSTSAGILVTLPVIMRATPTFKAEGKFSLTCNNITAQDIEVNSLLYSAVNSSDNIAFITATATELVVGNVYKLRARDDAAARLIFDANI